MGIEVITEQLDKIPGIIGWIRDFIITIIEVLQLPIDSTYPLIIGVAAVVFAFLWIKQFIATGFLKLSILINLLLLSILFYTVFVYV